MFAVFLSALLPLSLPPVAAQTAEPPLAGVILKVPATVQATPGRLCVIRVETPCKVARWIIPDGVESDWNEGGKKLTVVAPKGKYVLWCIAASAADQIGMTKILLDVGEGTPTPPPDVPVPPPDVPVPPVDLLAAELRTLFTPTPLTKAQAATLASIYRLAAKESTNAANATFADLIGLISDATNSAEGLGPTALTPIRTRVRAELTKAAPNLDAELTQSLRIAVADVYTRAAAALEGFAK